MKQKQDESKKNKLANKKKQRYLTIDELDMLEWNNKQENNESRSFGNMRDQRNRNNSSRFVDRNQRRTNMEYRRYGNQNQNLDRYTTPSIRRNTNTNQGRESSNQRNNSPRISRYGSEYGHTTFNPGLAFSKVDEYLTKESSRLNDHDNEDVAIASEFEQQKWNKVFMR
jgi:hypothetical protein